RRTRKMPFNSGGQTYQGGAYLMQGLGNLGAGIADAMTRYRQMEDQRTQADSLMQGLAQTPDPNHPADPNDPEAKTPMILDDKSYKRYLAVSGSHRAAASAGLMGALKMYEVMSKGAEEAALTK